MSMVEKLAGGREYRFRAGEIGHVHEGGILDIPFPRTICDALLDEGLAQRDHRVPGSGWITFSIRTGHDFRRCPLACTSVAWPLCTENLKRPEPSSYTTQR